MYKDSRRHTLSDIRSWDEEKIQIGYAELNNLFSYTSRIGYHAGVYGWNFDIYDIGNKVILTGYRSMIGRKPKVKVRDYEEKAKEILRNYDINYEQKQSMLDELIKDLAEKI